LFQSPVVSWTIPVLSYLYKRDKTQGLFFEPHSPINCQTMYSTSLSASSQARIWIVFLFLNLITLCESGGQKLPKALMITGNGNVPEYKEEYPPWIHEFQNDMIVDILSNIIAVDVTEDLIKLNPKDLQQYDLVICNSLFLTPTKEQLQALHEFVAQGKSYLTLHCGILSLLNWDMYERFIGGIFIGGPATVPEEFKVITENHEFWGYTYPFRKATRHPVSRAVEDFTIRDELYFFQPSVDDLEIIARAENHPVMWWHPFGKGKVMCFTLGHDGAAKSNPGYQELLQNGVRWLTGMPLVFVSTPRPFSTRVREYPNFLGLDEVQTVIPPGTTYTVEQVSDPSIATAARGRSGYPDLKLTGKPGKTKITIAATTRNGFTTRKTIDITVVEDGDGNIATYYGNTAEYSSAENASSMFDAINVIDGDTTTRWSSAPTEIAWVTVDLQQSYDVSRVELLWEASYGCEYLILGSENGTYWNTLYEVTDGDGGVDVLQLPPTHARYIKVLGTKRANDKWGYSIYELKIFVK